MLFFTHNNYYFSFKIALYNYIYKISVNFENAMEGKIINLMCRPVHTQCCRYRITCLTCQRNIILLPKCGYQSLSQNKLTSYRLCESMLGTHKYLTFKTSFGRKWFSNIHFIHLWTTFLQQINFCQSHVG